MIRVCSAMLLLLGLLSAGAGGQEAQPEAPPQSPHLPTQGPLPNNPDVVSPVPEPSPAEQPTPAPAAEPMASVACIVWGILGVGAVVLLVWIFGSRRQQTMRGAPYADVSHNPSVSGPYFPGEAPQPGMGGLTGFLGGMPGVYLVSRYLRRRRKDQTPDTETNDTGSKQP